MGAFAGLAAYVLILALVLGGGFFGAASLVKPAADVGSAAAAVRISEQQARDQQARHPQAKHQQAGRKAAAVHTPASSSRVERRADVRRESASKSRASIDGLQLRASDAEVWSGRRNTRNPRR
jgi:flagellar biosynthesis GTPase FlhF